MWKVLTDS